MISAFFIARDVLNYCIICVCLDTVTKNTKSESEDYIPLDRYVHCSFVLTYNYIYYKLVHKVHVTKKN